MLKIDNKNKIVWCDKELMNWYTSFYDAFGFQRNVAVYYVARVGFGYSLETLENKKVSFNAWDSSTTGKLSLINALLNSYSFRLERLKGGEA